MSNLERNFENKREFAVEEKREQLNDFLESMSLQLKAEGMPVGNDCRVDMGAFEGAYSPEVIKKDEEMIEKYRKEWYGSSAESGVGNPGEDLEMLKSAIFYKNLKKDFVVLRSSAYDDIKNGADNIIIERSTGNVVCALDEVEDTAGKVYEKKKETVLNRNIERNGVSLKYGLAFEKAGDKMKLKFGAMKGLPIFYLALPESHVEEGIKNFDPSEESSDYEKKLFSYFIASLNSQIRALELNPRHLDSKLKERLEAFKHCLKKIPI
ncbi:MAG: hypothetical protein AAB451_02595 [Patescibacteria group bacterium]